MSVRQLAGRTAVVTGASRGIGRSLALLLASRGARVLAVARSEPELGTLREEARRHEGDVFPLPGNLRDPAFLARLPAEAKRVVGDVDILVNNAGWAPRRTPFDRHREEDIRAMLELNLEAAVFLTFFFLPEMKRRNRGWVLNVGSAFAFDPRPGEAVYLATKAALHVFSRCLARELGSHGIRVGVLAPAHVDTALLPANRRVDRAAFLRPREVAEAALPFFLASEPEDDVEIRVARGDG
ncbi:MAG: hypothetical protein KatS3mg076_0591 [Candidatus Binatia bacterium]|nr:MAG: hypothetical protein KatS3mg076_0591 [Candidatus Binatia bacterium]